MIIKDLYHECIHQGLSKPFERQSRYKQFIFSRFRTCRPKEICKRGCETDPEFQEVDADKILEQYGNWGVYQMVGYYCTQLFFFPIAAAYFVMPFINADPQMTCVDKDGKNLTAFYRHPDEPTSACQIKQNEKEYYNCGEHGTQLIRIDNVGVKSLIYEFNLECENYFIKEAGYTVFTIAAMLFVPLISHLSDKYGRKLMFIISSLMSFILSAICGFLPKYWMFLICRALIGIFNDVS